MRRNVLIGACLGVILLAGIAAIVLMQGDSPAKPVTDDSSVLFTSGIFTSEIRSSDDRITFSLVPETAEERPFLLSWELRENGTVIRSTERQEVSLSRSRPLTMELVADRNPEAEYTFRLTISSPEGTVLSSVTSTVQRGMTGTEVTRNVIAAKQM